jgi:uncharacterized protein
MTGPAASLRLRAVHPLLDEDGGCPLLYDLERTFIIEVPTALRPRLGAALQAMDLACDLGEWLESEDLLTADGLRSRAEGEAPRLPVVTDLSLDLSGACNLGCVYCFENDIQSRNGAMSEETMAASLDFLFAKSGGSPRVVLHFGSGEPLLRFALLERVVAETERRAEAAGKTAGFELTTNATLATPRIAAFLRDHGFNVRVSCDGPAAVHDRFRPFHGGRSSYDPVKRGLELLLEHLGDRLTVNSVLSHPTRLSALWAWAKEMGFRRYHVIKVGAFADRDIDLHHAELREFREDLQAICDDLLADLEAERSPIDYQPVTKIVRRLMIPEPITRFCGVAGSYLGVASNGEVYPCFRHLGLEGYHLGSVRAGVDDEKRRSFLAHEAADVDGRPVCRDCWARYLCGGGCYADSTVYGPDRRQPQVQHCPFWRTEIELAIRFYDRLRTLDPVYCLRLFGDDPPEILESLGTGAGFLQRKNCA